MLFIIYIWFVCCIILFVYNTVRFTFAHAVKFPALGYWCCIE